MEKTMEQTELTVTQMLAELKAEPKKIAGEIGATKSLTARVTEILERAERLGTIVVPQVQTYLSSIRDGCRQISGFLDIPCDQLPEETYGGVALKLEAELAELKQDHLLPIQRAVHFTTLRHRLKDGQEGTMDWAIKEEYLCPAADGPVVLQGVAYAVTNQFGLTAKDRAELTQLFNALRGMQLKGVEERHTAKLATPQAPEPRPVMREINARDAWSGAAGRFQLLIPANGDEGGMLQIESRLNGGRGIVLEVTGASNGYSSLQGAIIPLAAIKCDDGKIMDGLRIVPPNLCEEDLKQWQREMDKLGTALKNGFRPILANGDSEIDSRAFLETGTVGSSTLTLKGDFKWESPRGGRTKIAGLSLRFSRQSDGQIALTKIVSGGSKADKLFGEALGQYHDPGEERFSNMEPRQIKAFLRLLYGQEVPPR